MSAAPKIPPEPVRHEPYDIDVEQAVIGSLLRDNSLLAGLPLAASQFYDALHSRFYCKIQEMTDAGEDVSPLTLYSAMKSDPGVIETGGSAYIQAMWDAAPSLPNLPSLARILVDLATRRGIIKQAEDTLQAAYEAPCDVPTAQLIDGMAEVADWARLTVGASVPILPAASLAGRDVPTRQEFVQGLIPARTVTLLGGDGGTGKSLVAAQLAAAPQTGATWLGRVVFEDGPVIFLSAEDELDELHRRFASIVEHQGSKLENLTGLHLLPLVGEDALLAVATPAGTLVPTALFQAIEGQIRKIRPSLVVLDNLSDVFGGDENSRVQARQFVTMLRRWCAKYDLTLVLLAHPSLNGLNSGSGTSGSTAWNNSVRSRLYLERVKTGQTEDDPDVRVLRTMKANYSRTGAEIRLRWDHGVFKVESEAQSPTALAAEARADRMFLELLETYATEGRTVSHTPCSTYAPAMFAGDKRSGGITKRAFTDAMNRLFSAGKIRVEEFGPPSKRRNRLVISGVEE